MDAQRIIKLVDDIPAYVLEDDIRLYQKYMSKLPDESDVIDVGSGLGKSALALAAANPRVTVWSFDSGEYPIQRKWTDSLENYAQYLNIQRELKGLTNVFFTIGDLFKIDKSIGDIELIHIDGESGFEEKALEFLLPMVNKGGIILMRNYDRCKQAVDKICQRCEFLENKGKIQVIRKK